jgi:uncharacterized protein YhhL (DUF1145 family)
MYLVSTTPTKMLIEFLWNFTVVVHNLQMCMKEYCCCLKFRRGDNSTYTFTKRGGMYLVSTTPTKMLIEFLWNFTVVVHNLQMCMKEYCCCLKFRRGDNSTYTFTKRGVVYLVSATPPKRLIGVLWNFTQL